MACLNGAGIRSMAIGMMRHLCHCRFNRPSQHWFHPKHYVGPSPLQMKKFHNSPVTHHSDKLLDQAKKSIQNLKIRDNVPEDYHLIYKSSMELFMRVSYVTFLACGLGLIGCVIYQQYYKIEAKSEYKVRIIDRKKEPWVFSAGLILITIAAFSIMYKFPFRIYKHCNKKQYIAIYLNPIPPMLKHFYFTSATPTVFKNPMYILLKDNHYFLDNNQKTFLFSQFFRVPKDLTDMFEESNED